MTPYPHLFTPIKIGGQLIKNRIFSAPTGLMSYTARGHLTTENMAYYELKAKGGCGVVTLGRALSMRPPASPTTGRSVWMTRMCFPL